MGDLFQSTGGFLFGTVVPFLFVLTIVVFFHELGHYLVARWNKVKIEAFAVGFGPELFGFTDKHKTRWKVCAIPLGGYVKFLGDDGVASTPDREKLSHLSQEEFAGTFESKSVGQRAAIAVAGPIANFILAIAIFTATFMIYEQVVREAVVGEVVEGMPAEAAGFQKGDRITAINGTPVKSFEDLQRIVSVRYDQGLTIDIIRGNQKKSLSVTPKMTEHKDRFGNEFNQGMLGIRSSSDKNDYQLISLGPWDAFVAAVDRTFYVAQRTLYFIYEIITGHQEAKQLRGPAGIAEVSSQVATLGIAPLISLAALLSISIGLLNLFPIPMLDGGHLLYYAVEAIRGKALSPKMQDLGFRIGIACVFGLLIFATFNDITRILS
ncbi:MAG: RIP metalloprotease RseP [Pseudomonadota bacterium]